MTSHLPFSIALRPGEPVIDQVTFAVIRAVVTGQLRPGDAFPSVRTLSSELRVNPNTAHRIVAALIGEGVLAVRPGIGTVVADLPHRGAVRTIAFEDDAERLVIAAKRAGWTLQELIGLVRERWTKASRKAV